MKFNIKKMNLTAKKKIYLARFCLLSASLAFLVINILTLALKDQIKNNHAFVIAKFLVVIAFTLLAWTGTSLLFYYGCKGYKASQKQIAPVKAINQKNKEIIKEINTIEKDIKQILNQDDSNEINNSKLSVIQDNLSTLISKLQDLYPQWKDGLQNKLQSLKSFHSQNQASELKSSLQSTVNTLEKIREDLTINIANNNHIMVARNLKYKKSSLFIQIMDVVGTSLAATTTLISTAIVFAKFNSKISIKINHFSASKIIRKIPLGDPVILIASLASFAAAAAALLTLVIVLSHRIQSYNKHKPTEENILKYMQTKKEKCIKTKAIVFMNTELRWMILSITSLVGAVLTTLYALADQKGFKINNNARLVLKIIMSVLVTIAGFIAIYSLVHSDKNKDEYEFKEANCNINTELDYNQDSKGLQEKELSAPPPPGWL